jgi:hypothetical protein
LGNVGSPTRQLKYQSTSLDPEITECSPEQPVGVMENTLKAKLLQARLEGQHARLKASGGSSTSRRTWECCRFWGLTVWGPHEEIKGVI